MKIEESDGFRQVISCRNVNWRTNRPKRIHKRCPNQVAARNGRIGNRSVDCRRPISASTTTTAGRKQRKRWQRRNMRRKPKPCWRKETKFDGASMQSARRLLQSMIERWKTPKVAVIRYTGRMKNVRNRERVVTCHKEKKGSMWCSEKVSRYRHKEYWG